MTDHPHEHGRTFDTGCMCSICRAEFFAHMRLAAAAQERGDTHAARVWMDARKAMADRFPKAEAARDRNEDFDAIESLIIDAIQRSEGVGGYKTATVNVYSLAEALIRDWGDGEVKDWLRSLRDIKRTGTRKAKP